MTYTSTGKNFISFATLTSPPLPVDGKANNRIFYTDTSNSSPACAFAPDGSFWWAWTGNDGSPGSINFQADADMFK